MTSTIQTCLTPLDETIKSPSSLDSLNNYIGPTEFPGWYTVVCRSRDSDTLTECNWDVALKRLGGESKSVQIHRFSHWACGWWEALAVHKRAKKKFKIAEDIRESLDAYPILDESAFSDAEQEAARTVWQDCFNWKGRIKYIRDHRNQFEFHDWADLMANVRGESFAGYASELLN